jgi:hypothetical protein
MKLLQNKIKSILGDSDITDDIEEQKITKFEYTGCIHENIAPKDFPKECN